MEEETIDVNNDDDSTHEDSPRNSEINEDMQETFDRYHKYVNAEGRHAKSPTALDATWVSNILKDFRQQKFHSKLSKTHARKRIAHIRDSHHRSLAHLMALIGDHDSLKAIAKINPSCLHDLDADGMTPLHYMVFSDASTDQITDIVMYKNLDLTAWNNFGQTAQQIASELDNCNFNDACDDLDDNFKVPKHEIHQHAKEGSTQFIKARIEGNFNNPLYLNARDENGNTMLHWAVINGHLDIVELLVEEGANINAVNWHGDTPLHLAAKYAPNLAKQNRENDKKAADDDQIEQPLENKKGIAQVVHQHGLAIVEFLAKQQADRHHLNADGKKPQEIARNKSPVYNMIDWKESRHQQKYNANYVNPNIDRRVKLDDFWTESGADKTQQNPKLNAALIVFKNELTSNYRGNWDESVGLYSFLQKISSHHDETFNWLINKITLYYKVISADANVGSQDLQKSNQKVTATMLLSFLKGDEDNNEVGAIKRVKLSTLQHAINTNGKLMGLFSHSEKMLRQAIENAAIDDHVDDSLNEKKDML